MLYSETLSHFKTRKKCIIWWPISKGISMIIYLSKFYSYYYNLNFLMSYKYFLHDQVLTNNQTCYENIIHVLEDGIFYAICYNTKPYVSLLTTLQNLLLLDHISITQFVKREYEVFLPNIFDKFFCHPVV